MGLRRRDVLKAMAAPLIAGTTRALAPHRATAQDSSASANGKEAAMNSRPLMTVRIAAAPPQKLGAVPHGIRTFVPVTGGSFEGPRLRGKILPGGGDWFCCAPMVSSSWTCASRWRPTIAP